MELTLRASKTADVPRVRAAVVDQLRPIVEDENEIGLVALLLTELLSNALRHSSQPVMTSVVWSPAKIHVEVCDDNPATPIVVENNHDEPAGRGMKLVSTLANRWGWNRLDSGKCVWFEIRHQDARVPA